MTVLTRTVGEAIEAAVRERVGHAFRLLRHTPVGGGCICDNYLVEGGGQRFFVKTASSGHNPFPAEADGLAALSRCPALVVPQVVATGRVGPVAFLVLTYLDLQAEGDDGRLGEAVALLHQITYPRFGWPRDNFIGSTPQANAQDTDWPRFWREQRLLPQLRLAARRGAPELLEAAAPLLEHLPALFTGDPPAASLLHGDLWCGNKGFVSGRPCLFDPAVYAGDSEADLAMAELFGGFSPRFVAAYRSIRPSREGDAQRRLLYQLYHVLNHFNLFGGGYARQAAQMLRRLAPPG